MTSVRELIDGYRATLLKAKDLQRNEASTILVELSALVGNVNEEILGREMAYNRLLNDLLSTPNMTASAAKIRGQASEQYEGMLRAKGYLVVVTEMARALKYRLKALDQEQQLTPNL